ncbi:unnamed protein product [Psylliodes chrysocephalus]|uniref:Uncharacterized protein n=1 Tax=Psylliodes chrysocephalus TaxID=3402493 RepID=A0A9P0GE12_9CUCU|nr:unnamed protein product [Psylliodes chrysocephala]
MSKLEEFARNDLPPLLEKEEKLKFYGIFVKNIGGFKILEGHKKLINILSQHCQSHLENRKRKTSDTLATSENKKKRTQLQGKVLKESTSQKVNTENSLPNNTEDVTEDENRVIEHVKTVVKNYQKKFLNTLSDSEQRNESLSELDVLSVEIKNGCAFVKCPKCNFISKAHSSVEKGKQKYVLSNVNRHYKTHFKNQIPSTSSKKRTENCSILSYFRQQQEPLHTVSDQVPIIEIIDMPTNISEESQDKNSCENFILDPTLPLLHADDNLNLVMDSDGTVFCPSRIMEEALPSDNSASHVETPRVTYSRSQRIHKSRFLNFDNLQLKLTDYYELCENIKTQVCNNPVLKNHFKSAIDIVCENNQSPLFNSDDPSTFIEMLKEYASKNVSKTTKEKAGNRYSVEFKKFCLYIFLTAGRLAYDTIYANLFNGLPSVSTLTRTLSGFEKCLEGDVQFGKLHEFLVKRKYPLRIFVSEDQTAIIKRVRYYSPTNQIVGCVPVLSQNSAFPLPNQYETNFNVNEPVVIQDTIHIATKLKTRLLNTKVQLTMGNYTVNKCHLETIIKSVSKDKHFLCLSYLDGTHKMNFESIDSLSAPCVTDLLENEEFKATQRILIITRYILDSFLDKSISIERRVYLLWYATFFLRLWRSWIKEHNTYNLSKNWLTSNTYVCIELNAHALLILIEKCRQNENHDTLLSWLYSSQPCERFFRQTRSMTSTYETKVNFDMLDILRRKHRIQALNDIVSDSEKFVFPREKNSRFGRKDLNRCEFDITIPSVVVLRNSIDKARQDVINDAKELQMILPKNLEKAALEEVSITHIDSLATENIHETQLESNEINEDVNDIDNEMSIFDGLEDLNIKDFRHYDTNSDSDTSFLNIIVNNKKMKVKKINSLLVIFN